jgi:hypothetical protein
VNTISCSKNSEEFLTSRANTTTFKKNSLFTIELISVDILEVIGWRTGEGGSEFESR